MDKLLRGTAGRVVPYLVMAGVSAGLWAAWLGWDQERDVLPNGDTTGPYEAWQVIGLVVCLLVPVWWGTRRGWRAEVALGVTAGLCVAASLDWAPDSNGLFVIGVMMVAAASLTATTLVSAIVRSHFSDRNC
ncbi:hypothetical protein ACVNF4_22080 [Streptomyces sp. S6]